MAMQINTNKANLSNKVLLYFSYPLKHTHYNLLGGIVWICGLLPFLPFFGVLRNSLILPHQWHSPEKSRLLHCQPHRVPVLFDSVFCGSLDTPQPPNPPTPVFSNTPSCCIVWLFYYFPNQIQGGDGGCILRGG